MDLPLSGRRVLITRTRSQASALVTALEQVGAIPLVIPMIEIAAPLSFDELDAVVAQANTFDWLVFTSANAVQAFSHRSHDLGSGPIATGIACVGPSTAATLRASGLVTKTHPILLPPIAVAESLAEALRPEIAHLLTLKQLASLALIRAESARDYLSEALSAAGATLTIAPAYRNIVPVHSIALLREAFEDPSRAPEAITFTSSSTVNNFVELLAASGLPLRLDLLRISIGPVTSATLTNLGLPPHAEAEAATIPSLVAALEMAFVDAK